MDTQRALSKIQSFIDYILAIFGNRFKGYRMLIAAIILGLLSFFNYATNIISDWLCEKQQVLCDLKTSQWVSLFIMLIALGCYIGRKLIDIPAADFTSQFFIRFTAKYKDEVQRLRRRL